MEDEACEVYAEDSGTQAQTEVSGRAGRSSGGWSPSWKNTVIDESSDIDPQNHALHGISSEGKKAVGREEKVFSSEVPSATPFDPFYDYGTNAQQGHQSQPQEGDQAIPSEDGETLSIDSDYMSDSEYTSYWEDTVIDVPQAPLARTVSTRVRMRRPKLKDATRKPTADTTCQSGGKTLEDVDGHEMLDKAESASLHAARCFVCGQQLGTSTIKAHIDLSANSGCQTGYLTLSRNLQKMVAELLRARYHEQEESGSCASSPAESCKEEDSSNDDAHEAPGGEKEVPPSLHNIISDSELHSHGEPSQGARDGQGSAVSPPPPPSSSFTKHTDDTGLAGSACNQEGLDQNFLNTNDGTTQQAKSKKRKRCSVEDRGVRCICCVHEGIEGQRYECLAAMHRHVQSHHDKFICQRCFTVLKTKEQFLDHYHGRDPCSPQCRTRSCQRYLRASCSWMLVSDPCAHLKTRDEQWWAAYNVLYNPDAEQASKQGPIDFNHVSDWDGIPLESIETAYEQVAMAEKDTKIAELEQNMKTISENMQTVTQQFQSTMRSLQEMTAKSQSQQDLLYTLWQRLCASGCTDTYLLGMVQRTAPELLGLDAQSMSDSTRWKGKHAAVGPVMQNEERIFGIDSTLSGFEDSPGDSGIWPGPETESTLNMAN